MFYEVDYHEQGTTGKKVSGLVVLNPAESRRLLARATVACAEVRKAMKSGMVIIGRGVTTAFVSEEIFGIRIERKGEQTVGSVFGGMTNANIAPPPCTWHVIRKGKVVDGADSNVEILDFGPEDVFIKGANAIDAEGNAGIFVSNPRGGTIGMSWPIVTARGSRLIMPVSLEKQVSSVQEAFRHSGIFRFKYSTGLPIQVVPVTTSLVITEIQAFGILTGVRVYHLGSGGIGGSEGAVILGLEGSEERMKKACRLVRSIKGEPAVASPDRVVVDPKKDYGYEASFQLALLSPELHGASAPGNKKKKGN